MVHRWPTAFGLYIRFIGSLDEPKTFAEDICVCDHDQIKRVVGHVTIMNNFGIPLNIVWVGMINCESNLVDCELVDQVWSTNS